MDQVRLELTRAQILGHRRRAGALDVRLPPGASSLRRAVWAGAQDSMPRAALLSLHARVERIRPDAWEDRSLVQLWGPRYGVYVVAARDLGVFSLGTLPDDARGLARAHDLAARLAALLGPGGSMPYGDAGHVLGVDPNRLRYAAATGTVLLRWDGARLPEIRTVPAPDQDPRAACRELARRHLHVFGPTTPEAFAGWAGIAKRQGASVFDGLARSLVPVRTPVGDGWILARDEDGFRAGPGPAAPARLLPSGDAWFLRWGRDRELVVPDAANRERLWTSRVWPGAVLVGGEVAGTWRRAHDVVTVEPWRTLTPRERDAVQAEAVALPLPGVDRIAVVWAG